MNSELCNKLGIEFPLFAFSHCRDVVAAVTNAGGMGVFGAVNYTPEQLDVELSWIDEQVNGKPYGVDLIVPNSFEGKGDDLTDDQLLALIPETQSRFTQDLLSEQGIDAQELDSARREHLFIRQNLTVEGAKASLDVAFSHPISLIANALGVPPQMMIDRAKENGTAIAALVGAKEHALAQVSAGVDIIVAVGTEAGGHCGEISTMVLVPEIVEALSGYQNISILAAGGIATGEQMAASMAMGADGVWCGSVWLTTSEAETGSFMKEKMLAASSRDTIRSRSRTGKPSRQLRSPWTDAWEDNKTPSPLPMPLQTILTEPAHETINRLADRGHQGAQDLATYWVGQAVGLMNQPTSAAAVVQDFKVGFARAYDRLERSLNAD